jgi:hypothetical protein
MIAKPLTRPSPLAWRSKADPLAHRATPLGDDRHV